MGVRGENGLEADPLQPKEALEDWLLSVRFPKEALGHEPTSSVSEKNRLAWWSPLACQVGIWLIGWLTRGESGQKTI